MNAFQLDGEVALITGGGSGFGLGMARCFVAAGAQGVLSRRRGSILFTASMTSLFGIPSVVAYAAAKSAYLGMVRTLATELSPSGVRVNAIAPGWIDSPMLRQALGSDPPRQARILARTP